MESREKLLSAYGRYLELEQLLPFKKQKLQAEMEAVQRAKEDMKWYQIKLVEAENPDFFQRLLGNREAKIEKAREEVRTASAEYEKLKWSFSQQEVALSEDVREFNQLAEIMPQCQQMLPLETQEARYLAPAAVFVANECHEILAAISPWATPELRQKRFTREYGYWNLMEEAESYAETLMRLLSMLPEGAVEPGDYLQNPNGYIRGMATKDAQLIRLSKAMEQIRGHLRFFQDML